MGDNSQDKGLVGNVVNWFQHPFQSKGSALNWILFVGLLIIAAFFWNHILLMIQGDI